LYKRKKYSVSKNTLVIDVFFLVDKIIKENTFCENYFSLLYPLLKKKEVDCVFIPRLSGLSLNPIKAHRQLKSFLKVMNQDNNNFLFEFELLSFKDFLKLILLVMCYPFKTLRLIVKEKTNKDIIFNKSLLTDISKQGFDIFTRYIFGSNISNIENIYKIYSWSEFQSVERSFNYAIRKNSDIKIYACQLYINYPVYFNSYIQDIDELNRYAPHKVFVNGSHYLLERKRVKYQTGVSLRYKKLFDYKKQNNGNNVLVMGSYQVNETKNILRLVKGFDSVLFKNHPIANISDFKGYITENIKLTHDDAYNLFPKASIVIGSASGVLAEAVACGVSVIVVAREGELITNPLVDLGKGKIWDTAFSELELKEKVDILLEFRKNNLAEVNLISNWYKNNFFIEPTEENISKMFEL
jgi:hypothetical protein